MTPVEIAGRVVGVLNSGVFELMATDMRATVLADTDGSPMLPTPFGVRDARPALAQAMDFVEHGYDPDIELVRMGARDYDPLLGQFTTPDPLMFSSLNDCQTSPIQCNLYTERLDAMRAPRIE